MCLPISERRLKAKAFAGKCLIDGMLAVVILLRKFKNSTKRKPNNQRTEKSFKNYLAYTMPIPLAPFFLSFQVFSECSCNNKSSKKTRFFFCEAGNEPNIKNTGFSKVFSKTPEAKTIELFTYFLTRFSYFSHYFKVLINRLLHLHTSNGLTFGCPL